MTTPGNPPEPDSETTGLNDALPPNPPDQPRQIGRYLIVKTLGEGGFGRVHLARDEQLGRPVAIKVPHRRWVLEPADAEAYLAEARVLASLDHPNIVPVYDVGTTSDGMCYVVSKLIEGSDLAQKLKKTRLSYVHAAELVATVAEALHHAHRQGLVHRDIKPANILLDSSGKPYVADFGLALKMADYGKGHQKAGTPAYMSPEQARGEGHRVDGRSDLFSLGVVLYEMLAGQRPYHAETQTDLLDQVATAEARPPRQIDDDIPKELERICLKALAKRVSERYTTGKDMAEDLRHFLAQLALQQHSSVQTGSSGGFIPGASGGVNPGASGGFTPGASGEIMPGASGGFIPGASGGLTSAARRAAAASGETQVPPGITPSNARPIKIVPKGLRSFDAGDANFFLELLPGPRDRDGLPDSIRFWKNRIEARDAENSFNVGLIYGPSGCGKSSLVKAGLLPHLADHVTAVYIEATAADTEIRLAKALRKHCPDLPAEGSLTDLVAALRTQRALPAAKKVLIVLDQFEQWLHARGADQNTELVQALRQCDGERVQCIVMVRDDFWLAVSRFMGELEVELLQGHNMALTDLFDARHARRVLTAFGRAFRALPEQARALSKDQEAFLDQTVAGLSQDGKIVSVRLALFAEMVKAKPWTPATLKKVGGMTGVGVTFLEETFAAPGAPPQHRLHQKAAEAVLRALLPESGSNIKGQMQSQEQLLAASGYSQRPKDFEALVRILDGELRLITPTDPQGDERQGIKEGTDKETRRQGDKETRRAREEDDPQWNDKFDASEASVSLSPGLPVSLSRYFQLTHDYLVPSLRDWLTRKQRETRRGRAELRLADYAAVWNARQENRQLPSLLQWCQLRLLTAPKDWTPQQRKMMRKAGWHNVGRVVVVAAVVALLCFAGWEGFGRLKAQTLRDQLLVSTTGDVAGVIKEMGPYRHWVDPLLFDAYKEAEAAHDSRKLLHVSLALLPVDSGQVDYLYGRLLKAEPQEVIVIREALFDYRQHLTELFWKVIQNPENNQDERLRASCALTAFAPGDPRWEKAAPDVAATLVTQKPFVVAQWTAALRQAGKWLIPPLADFLVDEKRGLAERGLIASVYGTYAAEVPGAFASLENKLAKQSKPGASVDEKIDLAKRQASIGVGLLVMGRPEKVWPLLKHQPDPTLRSFLMERLGPAGVDANALIVRLDEEKDESSKRAILLSLGDFGVDRFSLAERRNHLQRLLQMYRDDPDPGIHGAAEWLLRQWGAEERLQEIDKELGSGKAEGKRHWVVNRQGQTLMIVSRPEEFWMGEGEERHKRQIGRSFAIASKEVTVEQFLRFRKIHPYNRSIAPTADCPINSVSWFDAAEYCNWLSEQEGIPKDQWCYLPNESDKYAKGMKMAPNCLERTGYRFPTEAEWEYACRAGADTAYSFGNAEEILGRYAWYVDNSFAKTHPVGLLKPNDLGLWDMHGNAVEWVQDVYVPYPKSVAGKAIEDKEDPQSTISDEINRVMRGGDYTNGAMHVRTFYRGDMAPGFRAIDFGFRLARTQ